MSLNDPRLREQPFHETGTPSIFVRYESQQQAFRFLEDTLIDERGISVLTGPESSGKSVLVTHFARELKLNVATAVVDGSGLYASQLLSKMLAEFGYEIALNSTDELLKMLSVFAVQQAESGHAPLLVVDNVHGMYPGALNVLCKLATIRTGDRYAIRMILAGTDDCTTILQSSSMRSIADRLIGEFALKPMSARETSKYLYEKLHAAGVLQPDDVFPVDVCDRLYGISGGWPGAVDRAAKSALEGHETDEGGDAPRLVLTRDHETLADIELVATRLLIGRSELCDVLVPDQFVSKQHALMVWDEDAVILVDLNSSNGTYVNSRRIRTRILRHNDIISMGDHRIKLIYEKAGRRTDLQDAELADTARMKNIADARRARAVRRLPLGIVRK